MHTDIYVVLQVIVMINFDLVDIYVVKLFYN